MRQHRTRTKIIMALLIFLIWFGVWTRQRDAEENSTTNDPRQETMANPSSKEEVVPEDDKPNESNDKELAPAFEVISEPPGG